MPTCRAETAHLSSGTTSARHNPEIGIFIERERAGIAAADWNRKFGRAHAHIAQQVLPAFSEELIFQAKIAADDERLYLPPEAHS